MTSDEKTFARRDQLVELGVDRVRELVAPMLPAHAPEDRLVLLRFERLGPPERHCHRTLLAQWWRQEVGQVVPELQAPIAVLR